ncbi:hypothetical protein Bca52824_011560 [Brassica carinata]|uniref:Uncharacterized protein n=1 Tax=Brassica carinata TaxID=52824 RepID=A0A8X7VW69_BRACI|nr:hypothetical protein Bca52824_011560 [Brassica carinata]
MVHLAIDGMWQVFKLKRSTPRNDFCRIAAKNGILLRLINTLYSLNEATLLASEGRSGQLDQHETSLSVVDNPDVLKTRHVGGEEPSRASASNPQRSDVYQPDGDRPRLSSAALDATEDVKPHNRNKSALLSLLEKEPPSRHVSGQLDYVKHITGLEKHESILPLLRASIEKKTNGGDLDFLMAEFAGKQNGNLDTLPRYYSSGVLNARLGSDTSSGLLSHMVTTLSAEVASQYLEKVADLLLEFARADTTVKSYMCSQSLLSRLFHMFNRVEPPILLKILKCTNHLSTDPNCLESLQRADAIKHLIPNLEVKEGNLVDQIHHEAVYEHHPRPKQLIVENDLPQRLQNLIEET